MPDNAILNDLLHMAGEHMSALIRQAYEAGRKAGEDAAKEKVLSVFGEATSAPLPVRERGSLAEMARVSRPLRDAIASMDINREGVGPNQVFEFVNKLPDMQLDIGQVRAGIKTLEKRGDLVRVSRGRYRPSARLLGQSEDQKEEAPNSSELFGAPKANGLSPLSP
jgi:hypothetical protein